jgi:hypothetical protein
MNISELLQQGENAAIEFKESEARAESLAEKIVAELMHLFQQSGVFNLPILLRMKSLKS